MRELRARRAYYDIRTGDTWDLFFPGYYASSHEEPTYDDHVVDQSGPDRWLFNPLGFDLLRSHIQAASDHRWEYSGDADLVVASYWLPEVGEPTFDWESVRSGVLSGTHNALSLGNIIELISRDLEQDLEDPDFGVGVPPDLTSDDGMTKKIMIGTLSGIVAALGKQGLGL